MTRTFDRKLLVTLMIPVIGAALAMPVHADARQQQGQSAEQETPSASRSESQTAGQDARTAARTQGQDARTAARTEAQDTRSPEEAFRDMRISRLRGMDVTNAEGERLGSVEDVVLDLNNQEVQYVVLSHGGFLGFGDKRFMFPVKAFKPGQEEDKLVLNVPKEQLENAPDMDKGKWNDPAYRESVDRHFGGEVAAKPDPKAQLISASSLVGKEVHNRTGQSVGDVEDIVVSLETGKVHYVAMDFSDSDKLVPVALQDLAVTARQVDQLVLNTDMSQIDMASAFDQGTWPKGEYPRYQAGVDQSGETGTGRAGQQEGTGAGASVQNEQEESSRNSLAAANTGQATMSTGQEQNTAQHPIRDMRVSEVLDMEVRNPQGEELGTIEDLVLDVKNEQVHYVVLSHGGILGVGNKLFAYPIKAFQPGQEADKLVLNMPKERLENAPGIDKDQWPDWSNPRYRSDVDRYFGEELAIKSAPDARLMSARELIGRDVEDSNRRDIGEIEDIVVNVDNGKVRYMAVEFTRDWNLNDKLVVIAPQSLDVQGQQGEDAKVVLNVDRSRLDTSKAFDKDNWPNINDPQYRAEVDRHLAATARPEEQRATGGAAQTEGAGAGGSRAGGDAQSQPGTSQEAGRGAMPGNSEAGRGGQAGQPGSANR